PLRRLAGDVFEVGRLAPDHATQRDDSGVASGAHDLLRGLGQFPGPRHPESVHVLIARAVLEQTRARARDEALRDEFVEPARDESEPLPGAVESSAVFTHGLPLPLSLRLRRGRFGRGPVLRLRLGRRLDLAEEVPQLVALRRQVAAVEVRRHHLDRLPARDLEPVPLEADDLPWVVREEPDRREPQIQEDLRANPEVPEIRLEAERFVRLNRVLALILERVRADLVREPDPPSLLTQVDDGALALLLDPAHRGVELLAAVAAERVEDVARQTFGVHSDEHVLLPRDVALDERDVLAVVDLVLEGDDPERAGRRGQHRLRDPADEPLVPEPVRHDLRDRDETQPVLLR